MNSQRDLLEVVVAVAFFVLFGVLVVTGHMDSTLLTAMIGGVTAILAWFFTRSGFASGSNTNQQSVGLTTQDVQNIVNQTLVTAAQTPAQVGVQTVGNQTQSNGIR